VASSGIADSCWRCHRGDRAVRCCDRDFGTGKPGPRLSRSFPRGAGGGRISGGLDSIGPDAEGAIARWPDQPLQAVIPYWSSYAAMGLSRAAQVTGNTSDAAAAWAYLDWYASEENAAGYVTDFTVVDNTTLVSTGSMDSTDAYAGTFLTAAWDTFVADPDPNELQRLLPG